MSKLIVTEFMSLDGVMEAPGGEPTHPNTGWVGDYFHDDIAGYKLAEALEAESHLLGRTTYESFAGSWPQREGPFADKINAMPKYVVSTTIGDPGWNNVTVLRDLDAVADLRERSAGPILVAGSATLVRGLLEHDLVDELRLMVFPVVIGGGLRPFADDRRRQAFALADTRTFAGGVAVHTYTPAR
jgi:dihydrofolate reductase